MEQNRNPMEDIANKINTTFAKWRQASGFLRDHQVSFRLKEQFHKMALAPALLYETGVLKRYMCLDAYSKADE